MRLKYICYPFVTLVVCLLNNFLYVSGYQYGAGIISPHYSNGYRDRANKLLYQPKNNNNNNQQDTKLFLSATATSSILDQVKDVVSEQLGVDREKVESESSFIGDLGADSLDSVELVMAFEEKFGVSIPDEEASKIKTVQDAVSYISSHKTQSS